MQVGRRWLIGWHEANKIYFFSRKLVLLDEENREAVIYDADFFKMKFQRRTFSFPFIIKNIDRWSIAIHKSL